MKNTRSITLTKLLQRVIAIVFSFFLLVTMTVSMPFAKASAASAKQINYFGTVVPCGKDNGYKPNTKSSWNPWTLLTMPGTVMGLIADDDPHKGWSLGSFFVEGYSGMTESSMNHYQKNFPVYLKNAGDTVRFGFKLDQNITKLNGNSSLKIADDHKVVQDCWVEDPYVKGDFNHGVLIIVHTDSQGKETLTTYRDFLKGKSVGANTEVQFFEEGDYRVILCYEIYKDTAWNWLTDWMDPNGSWFAYRIESYFSIRNGNAMFFPLDVGTGSELKNNSCTETGFRVDLANSKYLKLSAKKENLDSSGTSVVEDTRFNKVVADGTEFTSEGKYTITVKNVYTDLTTEKVIYVGTNDLMRCNTVTGLSVSTIKARLNSGYTINADGTLKAPTSNLEGYDTTPVSRTPDGENASGVNGWMILFIIELSLAGIVGIVFIIKKIRS